MHSMQNARMARVSRLMVVVGYSPVSSDRADRRVGRQRLAEARRFGRRFAAARDPRLGDVREAGSHCRAGTPERSADWKVGNAARERPGAALSLKAWAGRTYPSIGIHRWLLWSATQRRRRTREPEASRPRLGSQTFHVRTSTEFTLRVHLSLRDELFRSNSKEGSDAPHRSESSRNPTGAP